jgi:hypothetical protein
MNDRMVRMKDVRWTYPKYPISMPFLFVVLLRKRYTSSAGHSPQSPDDSVMPVWLAHGHSNTLLPKSGSSTRTPPSSKTANIPIRKTRMLISVATNFGCDTDVATDLSG